LAIIVDTYSISFLVNTHVTVHQKVAIPTSRVDDYHYVNKSTLHFGINLA